MPCLALPPGKEEKEPSAAGGEERAAVPGAALPPSRPFCLFPQLGELGKGAGKGGGGGGTIREAGGAFGKREAAAEERYFK